MNMVPVTLPTVKVVTTANLMAQLHITDQTERALIEDYERAAVAHLDGWGGVLGRAIMPQVWKQEFCGWGALRLAMPDVSAITVTAEDADGNSVAPTRSDLRADVAGPFVIADGPSAARVFVQFTCALPAARLPVAQQIVRLIVAHWYMNREEVVSGTTVAQIPLGAEALISQLRWTNF